MRKKEVERPNHVIDARTHVRVYVRSNQYGVRSTKSTSGPADADIPEEMLLLDRVHRIPKPRHLSDATPRDVLTKVYYFHIKEIILITSRNKSTPHQDYPTVKLFADLSATTLKQRKDFSPIADRLRANGMRFRWGYPTKMIILQVGKLYMISTPEEGTKRLQTWGIAENMSEKTTPPSRNLQAYKMPHTSGDTLRTVYPPPQPGQC
ncbi:Hypothetical predicted protein [Pelobates cultripes]|uniref:Uncharacterized protein n=1 Tax=Pelobates cultripes TaxID=61616 RepID=A0AAD1VV97_PELCU|nr:Hypothetical predicted protein [Pelobates cultripes]